MSNVPVTPAADLYQGIRDILQSATTQARRAVNDAMVQAYWHVGRLIVEDEQGGEKRAEYGKAVLHELSRRLSAEFGKGFSTTNLKMFRQFYLAFPIGHTLCDQSGLGRLSWSHFRNLLRVEDMKARAWYANEAAAQSWSVRALDRQISTLYYERLLGNQKQDSVRAEAAKKIATEAPSDPREFIRDPYVLEFLGVQPDAGLYEQDVGQLDMHVRVFDEQQRGEGDNPTIGLILCSERNAAVAKYSALADKQQLFASKYQTFLPSEEELRAELERDRALLENAHKEADD